MKTKSLLLLAAAFACSAFGSTDDSIETKVRAARIHVEDKADLELKKTRDVWWENFWSYVNSNHESKTPQAVLAQKYYDDLADKDPAQVLWLMTGGYGKLVTVQLSDTESTAYWKHRNGAMNKIVKKSVDDEKNHIADHLRSKQISDGYLEHFNQQINDLTKANEILDNRVLRLESKIDNLERDLLKEREDRQKDKLDFFTQLKTANDRITDLETRLANKSEEAGKNATIIAERETFKTTLLNEKVEAQRLLGLEIAEKEAAKARELVLQRQLVDKDDIIKLMTKSAVVERERDVAKTLYETFQNLYNTSQNENVAFKVEIEKQKLIVLEREKIINELNEKINTIKARCDNCREFLNH